MSPRLILGFILLSFLALSVTSLALDIVTTDGTTYRNCEITRVEADALVLSHANGTARVPYEKLPEALQKKYFDPEKVAAYREQVRTAKEAAAAEAARAKRAQEEAVLKEKQKEKDFVEGVHRAEKEEHAAAVSEQAAIVEAAERPEKLKKRAILVGLVVGALFLLALVRTSPGAFLILAGAATTIYFWSYYVTTISSDAGLPVLDQRLIQNRLLGAAGGMVVCAAGIAILIAQSRRGNAGEED